MEFSVQRVQRSDKDGNTVDQYLVDGLTLPTLPGIIERLAKLPSFEARSDDVFLFAYPKSGTHWTWEIVNMLVTGDAENVRFGKDQVMFEFVDQDVIDATPSPRVVNSHLPFRFIPEDVFRKRNKIIHVMRNPKDIAVSSYNHQFNFNTIWKYDGQWDGYFELFMTGKGWCYEDEGWFGYVREWEQGIDRRSDQPILSIYYEELQQNPLKMVKKIATFLEVSYNEPFYQKILEKCSFQRMKDVKNQFYTDEERALWRDKSPKVFRKGIVGDWKTWFTVAQNERFDALMAKKMTNSKLKFTFEM